MLSPFDTIVAPITGALPAAVAWVRLSGERSWAIAAGLFDPPINLVEPRRVLYGTYITGDDGLALPFNGSSSYTGEDSVEFSMHGSKASVEALLEACLKAGARMAEPGEFTQRAFLNGRIDLTQAEAVRETVEAETERQLLLARRNRDGALRDRVGGLRTALIRTLGALEASVDFSEEIGEFDRVAGLDTVRAVQDDLLALLRAVPASRIMREGYRIVLLGPPNAGKSSLLNRLAGSERAIVTDIPGTTRDYIEERIDFGGVPVVVVDTAGLRVSEEQIEAIGIGRSLDLAAGADEVWYVVDALQGVSAYDASIVQALERPVTVVANKCDLGPGRGGVEVSAVSGHGLGDLIESVRARAFLEPGAPPINRRQAPLLLEALSAVDELVESLAGDSPDDLLSVLLAESIASLGHVTGETASADMIDRIFADFCIGK